VAKLSLLQLLAIPTWLIIAYGCSRFANPLIASIVAVGLGLACVGKFFCAFKRRGRDRAVHVAFVVAVFGAIVSTQYRFDVPPQMYVCAPPFGRSNFFAVPGRWTIVHCFFALGLGCVAHRFTEMVYSKPVLLCCSKRLILMCAVLFVTASVYLVDLRSSLVASATNYACAASFWLSLIGALYSTARLRRSYLIFATVLSAYLFLETKATWPFSFYLGPAPFLYRYYNSVSTSWVTAQGLFGIFLATFFGIIPYRHPLRSPTHQADGTSSATQQ
jgi:hypothetical protein